jgi:hypothetical protein
MLVFARFSFFALFLFTFIFRFGKGVWEGYGCVTTFVSESKSEVRDICTLLRSTQAYGIANPFLHWHKVVSISGLWRHFLPALSRAAGSILFIEFSYEPCVQPQTVSGWSSYRQTKTPNRQFFCPRFRAVRVSFLKISAKSSLVRSYVLLSWLFRATGSIIYIGLSYEPEKQP